MKIFFRTIHLYLSLAAGIVIAVLCFTGAVLVFEKELEQGWHPERYFVAAPGEQPRLFLHQVTQAVQAVVPQSRVTGVKVYADPARTIEVSLAALQVKGEGKPKGGEGGGPKYFVNPYSGQVIGPYVYRDTFFYTMFALHRGMVAGAVGKFIVGVSTLFFLFIIATGLVLWWPATGKVLRQRLSVKWDASWKRLNHDLHIVLGFYSALFLFVFAFTGLAWSFEWFNQGIFTLTNSEMKGPEPPKSVAAPANARLTYEAAYDIARQQMPAAQNFSIQLPKDSAEAVRVAMLPQNAPHESANDELYLDQYNGQVLGKLAFKDRNLGQRVRRSFKPVHTGGIFGLPSKIIALIACVLGVTFPITGVILWLNRLKKEKKQKQKQLAMAD
ncbi:PepSY-associated TM helix domain protein [Hymenobacter roseosalivarius DSM 11622]|uniref:PepSY-associated TM helix domain protein n=1 Tax=Hymenobacter roseosalivarius DSM 11622 TaxID=645990 RepID=A0A1W1VYV6_9BACT|nr:PepSY-associated TM helix domain-containing protein [Hymenobacter roseosalivarius]SMB98538.1 PepSY-associated TM helix domain protein [Hymenobacter roseosalivarius DSM 11622]